MFVEQIINNNLKNLQIHPWSQKAIILCKCTIKELSEYLLFTTVLNDGIIKKLKFFHKLNTNLYNPLLKILLTTNLQIILITNLLTSGEVINITDRLIKKEKIIQNQFF